MSTGVRKNSGKRSEDTMDDDSDDKDSKRKSRNLSEKKRRDQFNLLVNELSSMVATGSRKIDKSTVLKSTISFLKNHNEVAVRSRVNEIQEDWKPTFLTNEEFTHLVLEAVDGFIMVFSVGGQIFYASESITSLLGHMPNDVLRMTIYEMASEEEQNNLYNILLSPSEESEGGRVSFSCHLRRGGADYKYPACFEFVHFVGYFKSDEDMIQGENRYSGYSGEADTRLVFVGTGRIQTPQLIREMPLIDAIKSEFTSRHSLEWKFLFLDHRAPPIIGYLPFELLGTSGYDYYHVDDLDKVVCGHEALMQKGEGTSCYYRFLTKGQQWIWLQTRFYITYHQWNSKPEFIVCTHRAVSYVDAMNQNQIDDACVGTTTTTTSQLSPSMGNSSSLMHWASNNSSCKMSSFQQGTTMSDCTSMSADSPGSRHSGITHHRSMKCRPNSQKQINQEQQQQPLGNHQHQPQQQLQQQQSPLQQQFLEPQQYVTSIQQRQPIVAAFPSSTVCSPLQSVDGNVEMSQNQMQIDLQRKHAELQEIIGQQQAELKRVSEQLLMARLGVLPPSSDNPPTSTDISLSSYQNVSSTTTKVQGSSTTVSPSSIISPLSLPQVIPQNNDNNMMFSMPDSNTQSK